MRKIRQLAVALVALVAMVFCAAPAMAADGDFTITVRPQNESGLVIDGHELRAYKLFDVTYNANPESYAYTQSDAFEGYKYMPSGGAALSGKALADYLGNQQSDDAAMQAFAEDAMKWVDTNVTDEGFYVSAIAANGSATLNVGGPGYYLVVDLGKDGGTTEDDSPTAVSRAMLVTLADAEGKRTATLELKADVPTIDKDVKVPNEGDWADWVDQQIGQEVEFLITGTIPAEAEDYDNYHYVIHDEMSDGLSLVDGSIEVYSSAEPTEGSKLNKGEEYDYVLSTDADGYTFDVTITPAYIEKHYGESVYVRYRATVNENAVVFGTAGNPNAASIEYSNNPYDVSDRDKTPDSTVQVYTYQFNVFKFTGHNTPLPGAKFMLYTDEDCTTAVRLVSDGTNAYRVATAVDTPLVDSITTDGSGRFTISGLDAGTYYLKELAAPDGYNALAEPIEVKIEATGDNTAVSSVTVSYKGLSEESFMNAENGEVKVENKSGSLLPSTGGIGTTVFYVVGAALVVAAGVGIVVKRRASER